MANVKFTGLPAVANSQLTDIICAVQSGTSSQETLSQVLTLMQANIIQHYAGNPNGNVAGTTYGLCWDTTNNLLYVCTTTGNAASAVWKTASGLSTPVTMAQGGTGAALTAANGAIPYSGASAMGLLAPGSAGQLLQSGGAGAPNWTTPTYPTASGSSGKILISDGTNNIYSTSIWPNTVGSSGKILISDGTSNVYSTPTYPNTGGTSGSIIISDGTNKINSTSIWANTVGSAGKILRSDGTTNTYSTSTFSDTYSANTILYASAGNTVTGLSTTARSVLSGNSSGVPTWLAMTDGQIIVGSTSGSPAPTTLTAGAGISIANASNSITISGTGSGIGWTEVTGTSQAMTADSGYIANNAGLVTFTLPATAALGTVLNVVGKGAGGWTIVFNSGQSVQIGSSGATTTSGSVSSTNRYDSVQLVCTTANTVWTTWGGPQGNLTIA